MSLKALARAGRSNLNAPDVIESPMRVHTLRIYYRSAGGELLAFEAPNLTAQAMDTLRSALCYQSIAVGVVEVSLYSRDQDHAYGSDGGRLSTVPLAWITARLVVLPSQMDQPIAATEPARKRLTLHGVA